MNKHTDCHSLRTVVEKAFAGFAASIIVAFISIGTASICFPNMA